MTLTALTGGISIGVIHPGAHMSALYTAYAEYLERMLDESDELVLVDIDTVPADADWDRVAEWADIG